MLKANINYEKSSNCQAKKCDEQETWDYEYFPRLEKKWNKVKEEKLCWGCLQELQNYLGKEPQKWDKEISSTKKNITKIKRNEREWLRILHSLW